MKSISQDKTYERFIKIIEKTARLTKEVNISKYKISAHEETIQKLEEKNQTQDNEISMLKHDLRSTKFDLDILHKK